METSTHIFRKLSGLQTFRAFHSRNFRLLFLSTVAQSVGFYGMMVTVGWQVLEMTGSPISLGLVWAVRSSPFLFFGILAGTVTDKVYRQKLLIMVFIIMAACSFLLGFLTSKGLIQLWNILLLNFLMGIGQTFDITARQTITVDIVGSEGAMGAISLNAAGNRIIGIFGGAAAGLIIELFGIDWPYYFMVAAYLIGTLALFRMQGVEKEPDRVRHSTWKGFGEGVKLLKKNRIILILVAIAIICEIFGFSLSVLLPIFARDILKIGAFGLGTIYAAQSIGGVLGSLTLASLGNYKQKGRLILIIFLLFGVFILLFSQSAWYLFSFLIIIGAGATASGIDAMEHTMLQLNVTDEHRGRAMGIWTMSIGFGPVGHLTVGAMADLFSAPTALSINGTVLIVVSVILLLCMPRFRTI